MIHWLCFAFLGLPDLFASQIGLIEALSFLLLNLLCYSHSFVVELSALATVSSVYLNLGSSSRFEAARSSD